MLKVFDAVSKTAVTSLDTITLTKKKSPYVLPELLHAHTKFHLIQLKSVIENEA